MSREEFFNTYFTGQKELAFLATMGPADRGRFLSQVLGYERLRRAQELARLPPQRAAHRDQGPARRPGRPRRDRGRAPGGRAPCCRSARGPARRRARGGGCPRRPQAGRTALGRGAGRPRALPRAAHAADAALRDRDAARRDAARAEGELAAVAAAEKDLAPLREQLAVLPALTEEGTRLADLARHAERRKALASQIADAEGETKRTVERLARLDTAPDLERRYATELEQLRAARAGAEGELEETKTAWLRDRQDAETKLPDLPRPRRGAQGADPLDRGAGPEGSCPTCGRPVERTTSACWTSCRTSG
jgi:exonuclease SbcC